MRNLIFLFYDKIVAPNIILRMRFIMKKYYSDETKNQTVQEFINGKSVSKIHAENHL